MVKKDLAEYKRKYAMFRHHAWAGAIILSIILAIRVVVESIENIVFLPILSVVILYIAVALIFTYKYSAGLYAKEEVIQLQPSIELEKTKIDAEVEKEKLKIEKKKAKAEAKAQKKASKK